jgi:hypothetical protein
VLSQSLQLHRFVLIKLKRRVALYVLSFSRRCEGYSYEDLDCGRQRSLGPGNIKGMEGEKKEFVISFQALFSFIQQVASSI